MFWDDLVRQWRKGTKTNSPRLLRAAGGHVAVLPNPQRAPQVRPLVVVLAILALLLALLFATGTVGDLMNSPEPTAPAADVTSA